MATFKKLLAVLVALIITCAGTYFWVARQCKTEATRLEGRLGDAAERAQELHTELEEARRELEDLKVWRHLGEIQQRMASIRTQVDALNYGLALDEVAAVAAGLEKGEFGERFRQNREELLPFLDRCAEALKKKDDGAHEALSGLERRAFELLSGLTPGAAPDADAEPNSAEPNSNAKADVIVDQPAEAAAEPQPTPEGATPPESS